MLRNHRRLVVAKSADCWVFSSKIFDTNLSACRWLTTQLNLFQKSLFSSLDLVILFVLRYIFIFDLARIARDTFDESRTAKMISMTTNDVYKFCVCHPTKESLRFFRISQSLYFLNMAICKLHTVIVYSHVRHIVTPNVEWEETTRKSIADEQMMRKKRVYGNIYCIRLQN